MIRSDSSSSLLSLDLLLEAEVTDDVPARILSRSVSSSSSSTGSTPTGASPPSPSNSQVYLRRRDTIGLDAPPLPTAVSDGSPAPMDPGLMGRFLLGPHHFDPNPPVLRVRKESDFDAGKLPLLSTTTENVTAVRTREEIVVHFLMELMMLRRDAFVIFMGVMFQWIHSVFTNIAYFYHAKLTAAQRVPLHDSLFDVLPVMSGTWWMASEFLVYGMIFTSIAAIVSILFVRWRTPHGRPLYCIPIVRRLFVTVGACQVLRIVSFLITTLPGPSRQCLYSVPEDMTRDEMMNGPAEDRGNPEGWMPPTSTYDIIWRMDATNGCGDLMFSSHTIFTMMFVCITFTYFNWRVFKWSMVAIQIFTIPFILAAHKHYSVDVFTALYVTPLVFEMLKLKFPDNDIKSADMARHYGLRFYLARGASSYVVAMWGKEFYVDPHDLPMDMQEAHNGLNRRYPSKGWGAEIGDELTELDPMIV